MSRGFVKEGDQEEVPMIPPRAFLPAGVVNYVTPTGMELLLQERQALLNERNSYTEEHRETDHRITHNYINAKLELLEQRIRMAKVVQKPSNNEIAFGSIVHLKMDGVEFTIQITGVDEATTTKGKIPFTSPLAKALLGHHIGDFLDVHLPTGIKNVKVIDIH